MKKLFIIGTMVLLIVSLSIFSASPVLADTIQSGNILYSDGVTVVEVSYDEYGYNYQAHIFSGSYFNAYARRAGYAPYNGNDEAYLADNPGADTHWAWPYRDVNLGMKWNDGWLSNKDIYQSDGITLGEDHALDRHPGFASYIGSGAWLTNHMTGKYEDGTPWTYFVKIIAVSADATSVDGIWYAADGTEIGPVIWGAFAIIQDVTNDPPSGLHGAQYISPSGAGLGNL